MKEFPNARREYQGRHSRDTKNDTKGGKAKFFSIKV